jgi:large subunit ribosomal protein L10
MLSRDQKAQQIGWIKEQIGPGKPTVYLGYRGIEIDALDDLRNRIYELGGTVKVVKTRLLKIALKSHYNLPADMWVKPVALIIGNEDPVQLAKTIVEFAKDHEIVELFGGLIDSAIVDQSVIKQLATLPGREELLAKVVGSLAAPLRGLIWSLQWNQHALISVLRQKLN